MVLVVQSLIPGLCLGSSQVFAWSPDIQSGPFYYCVFVRPISTIARPEMNNEKLSRSIPPGVSNSLLPTRIFPRIIGWSKTK